MKRLAADYAAWFSGLFLGLSYATSEVWLEAVLSLASLACLAAHHVASRPPKPPKAPPAGRPVHRVRWPTFAAHTDGHGVITGTLNTVAV